MLVLSRKLKEKIILPTMNVAIQVVGIKGSSVRLGIEAPPKIPVLREELPNRATEWGPAATHVNRPAAEGLITQKLGRELSDGLKTVAAGLGLLSLQFDAGQSGEAKATLTCIQDDLRLLRYGLEGELENSPAKPLCGSRLLHRALLVEDNRNERELLAGFLRQSGINVDTAGDGSDALDYLGSHEKPDVVLLDMGLPTVDGATVVRQLRSNPTYAGLKIFGVSGHCPEEFDLECGPRGIDGWFQKPVDPAVLLRDLARELYCGRN